MWQDFEENYGLADQFRFMEREGTVEIVRIAQGAEFRLGKSPPSPRCRSRPRTPMVSWKV